MARPQPRFFVPFVPSWWKIADVTKDTSLSEGVRLGRATTNRGSAILHHEGTKGTKKGRRTSAGERRRAEGERQATNI